MKANVWLDYSAVCSAAMASNCPTDTHFRGCRPVSPSTVKCTRRSQAVDILPLTLPALSRPTFTALSTYAKPVLHLIFTAYPQAFHHPGGIILAVHIVRLCIDQLNQRQKMGLVLRQSHFQRFDIGNLLFQCGHQLIMFP